MSLRTCLGRRVILILLVLAVGAVPRAAAQKKYRKPDNPKDAPWQVKVDPGPPEDYRKPLDPKVTREPIVLDGDVFFPLTTSPFVGLNPDKVAKKPMRVYDLRTMKQVGVDLKAKVDKNKLQLSPDGGHVVTPATNNSVEVWSVENNRRVLRLSMRAAVLAFAGPDRLLTIHDSTDSAFPSVETFDIASGKSLSRFLSPVDEWQEKWWALTPGGNYFVLWHRDGQGVRVHIWEVATGKYAGQIEMDKSDSGIGAISFSPDGQEVAFIFRQGADSFARIVVYDVARGQKTGQIQIARHDMKMHELFHAGGTQTLQWLPDRQAWLYCGYLLLDRQTGALLKREPPPFAAGIKRHRFLDADYLATEKKEKFKHSLVVEPLPREEIKAAMQKARGK